jgi:hypothetical protein
MYPCGGVISEDQLSGELPGPRVPLAPVAGWPLELADPPPELPPADALSPLAVAAAEAVGEGSAPAPAEDAVTPELALISDAVPTVAGGRGVA